MYVSKVNTYFMCDPRNNTFDDTGLLKSFQIKKRHFFYSSQCPLPWVEDMKHLGNILQSDNSMIKDIMRAKFMGEYSLSQPRIPLQ